MEPYNIATSSFSLAEKAALVCADFILAGFCPGWGWITGGVVVLCSCFAPAFSKEISAWALVQTSIPISLLLPELHWLCSSTVQFHVLINSSLSFSCFRAKRTPGMNHCPSLHSAETSANQYGSAANGQNSAALCWNVRNPDMQRLFPNHDSRFKKKNLGFIRASGWSSGILNDDPGELIQEIFLHLDTCNII